MNYPSEGSAKKVYRYKVTIKSKVDVDSDKFEQIVKKVVLENKHLFPMHLLNRETESPECYNMYFYHHQKPLSEFSWIISEKKPNQGEGEGKDREEEVEYYVKFDFIEMCKDTDPRAEFICREKIASLLKEIGYSS